jgi:hypothetical protein
MLVPRVLSAVDAIPVTLRDCAVEVCIAVYVAAVEVAAITDK